MVTIPEQAISAEGAITVVIADYSTIDCQLLASAIQRHAGFRVVGCATSSAELVASVCTHRPGVALISARLQDGALAGLATLPKLRSLRPQSRPVILLDDNQCDLVVAAFGNGAKGVFCRNDQTSANLLKCARCVHGGQIWVNNGGVEHIIEALMQARSHRVSKADIRGILSKREKEVSHLVAAGLSNREISSKLGLSEHTVKNYLSRIFEKLSVSTRAELVLRVLSRAKPDVPETNHAVVDSAMIA
jgi:DNA-binding NarL/FixJ family response regulator